MKSRSFINILILSFLLPIAVFAQVGTTPSNLNDVARLFLSIFAVFVPVIVGLALVVFLWGVAQYIIHGDNEQKRSEARNFIIWGILSLFVMVSVWGLVAILTGTFGLQNDVIPFFPPPL
jgi:predicted permease